MTDLHELLDQVFTFTRRPYPVPADFRLPWRVALLAQILKHGSRGTKSSSRRLHVLDWAARSLPGMLALERCLREGVQPGHLLFRFDPTLSRALAFGLAEKILVRVSKESFSLTELGQSLAVETERAGIMERERDFLTRIRTEATEKKISALLRAEQ